MLPKPLLIGALAAGGAVAQRALQARVLDDLDASPTCSSARNGILSVYAQLPTPAAVLDDADWPTGMCEQPSFTGETAAAWSSYTAGALAVLASNTAVIASAFSACPDLVGRLPDVPDCAATAATATPAPTGAGSSTTASKTASGAAAAATGSASGPASSSTPDANAAPRMDAIVGTVLGAAGLVAVVAAF